MTVATAAGVRINYEVVGEGPAVVLLHGWGGCIASMGPIREALRADHTVITFDLPGFGESEPPSEVWGSEQYAKCVGELLADAGFDQLLCVIGHSFGGKVAAFLALEGYVRVDSLMLVGTPGARLPLSEETQKRIARTKRAKAFAAKLPSPIRRAIEARYAKLGSEDYRNASGIMRSILVKTVNEDIRESLTGIHVPTLLVFGANDTATPVEIGRIMEEKIKGSGLVIMKDSGHFPYLDEQAAFNAVARSFLASVAASGIEDDRESDR
ncbi:MAG: alpha/beta hydrolase [Coriobacteriia bacterium]|nr:alpha/beta hydrolase [Coriobacteriia bacterium]